MLEIAVCDDDRYQQGELEELLYSLGDKMGICLDVDVHDDGEGLVESVKRGRRYDLIYLDIEMEGMNGIKAAQRVREIDRIVPLVYITSHEKYMKEVFVTTPSGFVTKPVIKTEFEELFRHIQRVIMDQDIYYRFRYNKTDYKIPIHDILYFVSNLRTVEIVWKGGRDQLYKKLGEIEQDMIRLNAHFIRTHNSYLVNYRYIKNVLYDKVELMNGDKLPVSRSYTRKVSGQMWDIYK